MSGGARSAFRFPSDRLSSTSAALSAYSGGAFGIHTRFPILPQGRTPRGTLQNMFNFPFRSMLPRDSPNVNLILAAAAPAGCACHLAPRARVDIVEITSRHRILLYAG
jgi:hypothetical protein